MGRYLARGCNEPIPEIKYDYTCMATEEQKILNPTYMFVLSILGFTWAIVSELINRAPCKASTVGEYLYRVFRCDTPLPYEFPPTRPDHVVPTPVVVTPDEKTPPAGSAVTPVVPSE